jgi:hypothetical protein
LGRSVSPESLEKRLSLSLKVFCLINSGGQWQSVNDIIGQLPVDQTGLSFSDAETQFPINGESFSDAETQRPDDLQNVPVPVLRCRVHTFF